MKILKVLLQHKIVKLGREMRTPKYNKSKERSERQQVTMNDHQKSLPSSSIINLWLASLCPHGSHYSTILQQHSFLLMALCHFCWVLFSCLAHLSLEGLVDSLEPLLLVTVTPAAGYQWMVLFNPHLLFTCILSFHLLGGKRLTSTW